LTGLEKELRGLQGRQDRSEKTVGSFQEQLARFNQVKAQGNLSDEQALDVLQKQDAEQSRWTDLNKRLDELAGRIGGFGTASPAQQMVAEVMSEFRLDPKDPYVAAQFQGKQFANRDAAEAFAGRVLRDKTYSNQPTQAQAASTPGSAADSVQEKIARLDSMMHDPIKNQKEIKALSAELDAVNWGQ
jgi:predicted  nucleic acid-binding Zn-ribbon protein